MSDNPTARASRTVQCDPKVLSHYLTEVGYLAAKYGQGLEEQDRVDLFFREEDLLIVADFHRGSPSEEPLRYRASMPIEVKRSERPQPVLDPEGGDELNEQISLFDADRQRQAPTGIRVATAELIKALRNQREHSYHKAGILEGPVQLTYRPSSTDSQAAGALEIDPTMQKHDVVVFEEPDIEEVALPEPKATDRGVLELDSDFMYLAAGLDEEAGQIVVDPGESCPYQTLAITRHGLAGSQGPSGVQGTGQSDLFQETPDPVVLSPRFATAVSLTRMAREDFRKEFQRAQNRAYKHQAYLAATLATQQTGSVNVVRPLEVAIGKQALPDLMPSSGEQESALTEGLQAAEHILDSMPEALSVSELKALEEDLPVDLDDLADEVLSTLQQETGGHQNRWRLAGLYLLAQQSQKLPALKKELLARTGQQVVQKRQEESGNEHPSYDTALAQEALVELPIKQFRTRAKEAVEHLPEDQLEAWWKAFDDQLEKLGTPEAVRRHLLEAHEHGSQPPSDYRSLKTSADFREERIQEAVRSTQTRIWEDEDGIVYMGVTDPRRGTVMVSDESLTRQLLRNRAVEDLDQDRSAGDWRGRIEADHLRQVADRAVGLSGLHGDGRGVYCLLRHVGGELDERLTDRLDTRQDSLPKESIRKTASGDVDTFQVNEAKVRREDGQLRSVRLASDLSDPHDEAIQVIAVNEEGEMLVTELPVQPKRTPANNLQGWSAAISARRLHDMVDLVAGSSRWVELNNSSGLLSLGRQQRRDLLVPTLQQSDLPEDVQPIAEVAGVSEEFDAEKPRPATGALVEALRKHHEERQQSAFRKLEKGKEPGPGGPRFREEALRYLDAAEDRQDQQRSSRSEESRTAKSRARP